MERKVSIIIPAYNPNEELENLVYELENNNYTNIIIINDGSKKVNQKYFDFIEKKDNRIKYIENTKNEGKGKALKKGMEYYLKHNKNLKGIILADADGQHSIKSINEIYKEFLKEDIIILGNRSFRDKNVPFKSKIGNKTINWLITRKTNKNIKDSQTGLRAIPNKHIKEISKIKGNRFEYETNMIIYILQNYLQYKEVSIETIYINKNKHTNFKKIKDSINIISSIIKNL